MAKKLTYEEVTSAFRAEGYKLLSPEYKNCMAHLDVVCPEGHQYRTCWNNFQQNYRCGVCAGTLVDSLASAQSFAEGTGLRVLQAGKNSQKHQDVEVECPEGHRSFMSRSSLRAGHGCRTCNQFRKKTEEDHQALVDQAKSLGFSIEGFRSESGDSVGQKVFHLVCPSGRHKFTRKPHTLRRRGIKCPRCITRSKPEAVLLKYLESFGLPLITSTRKVIPPYELDFYFPALGLAVEFNGCWWHREKRVGKDYHFNKANLCLNRGVLLVSVFEHSWQRHQGLWEEYLKLRLLDGDLDALLALGVRLGLAKDGMVSRDLGLRIGGAVLPARGVQLSLGSREQWLDVEVDKTKKTKSTVTVWDSGWATYR